MSDTGVKLCTNASMISVALGTTQQMYTNILNTCLVCGLIWWIPLTYYSWSVIDILLVRVQTVSENF